jgi:cytochrome c-type biogenesis protein CcmH
MFRLILLLLLLVSLPACARELDPEERQRAQRLYESVRCPTCVAQSVKESDTMVSAQIREFIDRRIAHGELEGNIIAELQQYYGPAVSFRPEVKIHTLLLWFLPLAYLAFAAYRLFKFKA